MRIKFDLDVKIYKFCDSFYGGLIILPVRIPVTEFENIEAAIGDFYVPLLLGLDVLFRLMVILDFNKCIMSSKVDGWMTPLVKNLLHVYIYGVHKSCTLSTSSVGCKGTPIILLPRNFTP